jgi:hypothetical protein
MKNLSKIWVLVAVLSVIAGPAIGAHAAEIAKPSFGAARVQWDAQGPYERLILTVSTPGGKVVRQEVGAGQTPEFDLSSAEGAIDGAYTWELRLIPRFDAEVRNALAAARRNGDDAAIERMRAEGKIPAEHVQSGSFMVEAGSIVGSGETEPRPIKSAKDAAKNITAADQVIPDDLIVQGSGCFGFDCVNNESFGFDTIRMKENNTRIKFEDTSVGTFPTNDWQLTANDSASGGSSKFSIEDITGSKVPFTITAGAATNSIFVDSTGRLGLRTSTPVLDLHIATSNTPAIRLEQNNSGGFTAQTWDIAGNEANFFVRDVTGGSKLSFRIRPGAPTSSLDISADGDVGVGTASPANRLDIQCDASAATCGRVGNSNATGFSGWEFENEAGTVVANFSVDNNNDNFRMNSVSIPTVFLTDGTERVRIQNDGDVGINCNNPASDLVVASGGGCSTPSSSINAGATAFTASSSRYIKENLEPVRVPGILEKISSIDVYNYDFIGGPKNKVGLMAEDFHQVFQRGSDKLLDGQEVEMALWLAVKELTAQNKQLTERLSALEADLAAEKGNTP